MQTTMQKTWNSGDLNSGGGPIKGDKAPPPSVFDFYF